MTVHLLPLLTYTHVKCAQLEDCGRTRIKSCPTPASESPLEALPLLTHTHVNTHKHAVRLASCFPDNVGPCPPPCLFLSVLVRSSTRRPSNTVAATMPVCAPSAPCVSPSWTLRPASPRATVTSGWRRTTVDQVCVSLRVRMCVCEFDTWVE